MCNAIDDCCKLSSCVHYNVLEDTKGDTIYKYKILCHKNVHNFTKPFKSEIHYFLSLNNEIICPYHIAPLYKTQSGQWVIKDILTSRKHDE